MFRLQSGRNLAYSLFGHSKGGELPKSVIVYFHGFPSSRYEASVFEKEAERWKAVIISIDRPGFGDSDPHPEHTITSFVKEEVPQLVSSVTESYFNSSVATPPKFSVIGVSGGGPYACSALYNWSVNPPENLPPLLSVSFVAAMPSGLYYPGSFSTLNLLTQMQYSIFYYSPIPVLKSFCLWQRSIMEDITTKYFSGNEQDKTKAIQSIKSYMLANDFDSLVRISEDGIDNLKTFMEFSRNAFKQSEEVYSQAFCTTAKQYFADPGFRLENIPTMQSGRTAKVHIFQGGKDMQVAKELGLMLSKIPDSTFHFEEKESHASLLVNCAKTIMELTVEE
ncbi:hypothetical protein HK098_004535 [Nowakowskiella sp. JEL0407]|nr:hypothetical protein HK098_004535 [Nowakowskiella sp. JEL0407]